MKKALSLLLLFGGIISILQGGVAAEASTTASSTNSARQSVGTGSFILTAVATSSSSNTKAALVVTTVNSEGFFYLKNFGTEALSGLSMTQTVSASTIRYCIGTDFTAGDPTKCADGSNAISFGNGQTMTGKTLRTALAPGASYAFSCHLNSATTTTISVSVSSANLTKQTTFS